MDGYYFIEHIPVNFQIDTGADVSVIPEKLYKKLQAPLLEPTKRSLIGPSQDKLQVRGQFTGTLVHNSRTVQEVVYVVSALLTTFITPMGRFCFNHLPFGITSAPEFYQKRMSHILSGLPGVVSMITVMSCLPTTERQLAEVKQKQAVEDILLIIS